MLLRPSHLLAALPLILAMTACAPVKDAGQRTMDLGGPGTAAEMSALTARSAENLKDLLALYCPEAGMNREEALVFFTRFQPNFLPLVKDALPESDARYTATLLLETLAKAFPPLAWVSGGELGSAAGLRASILRAYAGIPMHALDEIVKRLAKSGKTDEEKLLKAGLLIGALENTDPDFARTLLFAKLGALYGQEKPAPWQAALLGALLSDIGPEKSSDDKKENSRARAIHRVLFSEVKVPEKLNLSAHQLEAFDWTLDTGLAKHEDGALPRAATVAMPRALRKHREGAAALRKAATADRLLSWELLSVTEALMQRCELPVGEVYAEDELFGALAEIQGAAAHSAADGLCAKARESFTATGPARAVWRLKGIFR